MGMIDQRGERRRVVCDGQLQAQGQAPDERGIAGEQRGIRLLADGGAARVPGRIATASGRPISTVGGSEQGPGPESEADLRTTTDQGQIERPRRFRCDEPHAQPAVEPRSGEGRAPGPLRARIALRHHRETPSATGSGSRASDPRPSTGGDDPASRDALAG